MEEISKDRTCCCVTTAVATPLYAARMAPLCGALRRVRSQRALYALLWSLRLFRKPWRTNESFLSKGQHDFRLIFEKLYTSSSAKVEFDTERLWTE